MSFTKWMWWFGVFLEASLSLDSSPAFNFERYLLILSLTDSSDLPRRAASFLDMSETVLFFLVPSCQAE